jgi:hypothetical protein
MTTVLHMHTPGRNKGETTKISQSPVGKDDAGA